MLDMYVHRRELDQNENTFQHIKKWESEHAAKF